MAKTKDLGRLLKSMEPELSDKEFVFSTIPEAAFRKLKQSPLMAFSEKEGRTLILERKEADENFLPYGGTWAMITLGVRSSLSAVGFLAAVTAGLAGAGISVNAVSAYYHDHLFVPAEKAEDALKVLKRLSRQQSSHGKRTAPTSA